MEKKYRIHLSCIVFIFLLISSCVKKEEQITQRIFEKYNGKSGFYLFDIPPYLISILIDHFTIISSDQNINWSLFNPRLIIGNS